MDPLALIAELRIALREPPPGSGCQTWMQIASQLEASLAWNVQCGIAERKLMERIREGIAQVYAATRGGLTPDLRRATVPLNALEALVRSRQPAETAWPTDISSVRRR